MYFITFKHKGNLFAIRNLIAYKIHSHIQGNSILIPNKKNFDTVMELIKEKNFIIINSGEKF